MTVGELREFIEELPAEMPVYIHQDELDDIWETNPPILIQEYIAQRAKNDCLRVLPSWIADEFTSGKRPNGLLIDYD